MYFFSPVSEVSLLLLSVPLTIGIVCLAIHFFVYSRKSEQWRKSNIPFLWPSFLIGHKYFLNLTKKSCLVSLDRIYKENSDKNVVGFFLGAVPMVLIRNPAFIKQVFAKNFDKAFETTMTESRNDEVAQNTITMCADKDQWKLNRRTLAPMNAPSRMSGEAFVKIRTQIDRLWAQAEKVHRSGNPLNVQQISANFMADILSSSLFSLDANSHEKQGEFRQMASNFIAPRVAQMLRIYAKIQFPGLRAFEPLRFIGKKHVESMANLIRQQMEHRKQHQSNENDLVDFLMRIESGRNNDKQGSEIDITNQMIGFAFSTAFGGQKIEFLYKCIPAWTMHLLSLHPEHQERIRREVSEVMQKHNTLEFTYEVVRDLRFTQQCLYETVRLFPSVIVVARICSEDLQIPGMDHIFKKGERVIFNPYSVHRDPAYFENPDKFNPDRFSPENKNTVPPDAFLAFGTGPRKCPGEKLGIFMLTTLTASLLHKFKIKPRSHVQQMDANDLSLRSFSLLPKEDVLVDIIPREIMAS